MARLGMAKDQHYYMPYSNGQGQGVIVYSRSGQTAPAAVFDKVFDLYQRQQQGDQNAKVPEGFIVEPGTTTAEDRVIPNSLGASVRSYLGDITESAASLAPTNPQGIWDFLKSLPARAVGQVNTPGKAGATAAGIAAGVAAPELLPLRAAAPWLETALTTLGRSAVPGVAGVTGYNVGELATGGRMQTIPQALEMGAGIAATQGLFEGFNLLLNSTLTRKAAAAFSEKVIGEMQTRFPALANNKDLLNNALTTKEGGQVLRKIWGEDLLADAGQVAQAQRQQLLGDIADTMKGSLGGKVPPADLVPQGTQGMIDKHFQGAVRATQDYLSAVSKGEKVASLYEKLSPYEDDIAKTLIAGTKDARSGTWAAAFPMTDDDLRLATANAFARYQEQMQRYVDGAKTVNLMQQSLDKSGKVDLARMKVLWDEERAGTPGGMQQYIEEQLQQSPFSNVQMQRPMSERAKAGLQYAPSIVQYATPPILQGPPGPRVPMVPEQLPAFAGPFEGGVSVTHPLFGGPSTPERPTPPPVPQGAPPAPVDPNALKTFEGGTPGR